MSEYGDDDFNNDDAVNDMYFVYTQEEIERNKESVDPLVDQDVQDILLQMNIQEDIERNDNDIDYNIDHNLETRFFQSNPDSFLQSRVGMTEKAGQDQILSTVIGGYDKLAKRQEKINRMYMSSQQIFSMNFDKACSKYGIEKNRVLGILELLFKAPYFEYKNPFGILFGALCLKGKNIDKKLLLKIHEDYASHENITVLDLIRYARFIKSLH